MDFRAEKKLQREGYRLIAGIDEAGRGALAGPVVASAVVIKDFKKIRGVLKLIDDSKKLSPFRREELYNTIIKDSNILWGTGVITNKTIDRINILKATKKAMEKAVLNLLKKTEIDFLVIDGNFLISSLILQRSEIRGDERIFSCAAASIIAKVSRDRMMLNYHKKYSSYGFDKNKGYGTLFHRKKIKERGLTRIHRQSFCK